MSYPEPADMPPWASEELPATLRRLIDTARELGWFRNACTAVIVRSALPGGSVVFVSWRFVESGDGNGRWRLQGAWDAKGNPVVIHALAS